MRFRRNPWAIALLSALITLGPGCAKAPSDGQLSQQIQARFSQDSGLQGKALSVQASAGVVTLSGRVENDAQRTAASRYAAAITGVKQVVNNLEVGPGASGSRAHSSRNCRSPAATNFETARWHYSQCRNSPLLRTRPIRMGFTWLQRLELGQQFGQQFGTPSESINC